MNFGEKLKEIRTYDLDIAKILEISKYTFGLYEGQYRTIPLKHLNTFCNKMEISFDYFFKLNLNNYKLINSEIDYKDIPRKLKEIRKENKLT